MRKVVLIIGLTFLLSGCTFFWEKDTTAPVVTYETVLSDASKKIKDTPEFEECMRPQAEMCVSQVWNKLAQQNNDITFCRELPASEKENCEYIIILLGASKSKNIDDCNWLSWSKRDDCRGLIVRSLMQSTWDVKKCDLFYWEIVSGETAPRSLVEKHDQCIIDYTRLPDIKVTNEICAQIDDVTSKKDCLQNITLQNQQ